MKNFGLRHLHSRFASLCAVLKEISDSVERTVILAYFVPVPFLLSVAKKPQER